MPDTPHRSILDRNLFQVQIAESFAPQLELLEQMVDYGTNLVPRCFDSSEKKLPDIVCIGSFLKHAVSALDAIHILIREGATTACWPHLRSIFEIRLYLEWIFEDDYANRGTAYFVWNIRKKRYWNRKLVEGTVEHAEHCEQADKIGLGRIGERWTQEDIETAIAHEDRRLNQPDLRAINERFSQKQKPNGRDCEWYEIFKVNNLRTMSEKLDKLAEYEFFYRQLSEATHGKTIDEQISFSCDSGRMYFEPLRTLERVDQVFHRSFEFAFSLYHNALAKYRPDELAAYYRKYTSEWRDPLFRVPKVSREDGKYIIQPGNEPPDWGHLEI